ncbi:MAG: alpha/beta hydrolase [Atopobiaceae bacterium]|nr:alpha/beta hydrolase [Atopobiaceae bacterium]
MPPVAPRLHFPSPYETPSIAPSCATFVATPDEAQIASFVYGDLNQSQAAPVLMLHGNGEEHGLFGPTIDAVVAGGRAVVTLDSRAQGKSTRGTLPLTYELMANDALAVLDHLDVSAAHVLGFSDGGIEALLLARDHANRVLSLTVLGANLTPEGVIEDEEWDMTNSIATNREWARYWSSVPASQVDTSLLSPTPAEAAITAELLQLMLDEPHIDAASLRSISCPTTIMVGEFDCITEEETHAIHKAIAGSQLVVVPEAGHTLPKQVPDLVTKALFNSIKRAERT